MPQTEISRRELLKTLLVTSGGLGVVFVLPGKWFKPVVEKGVLAPHAQISQVPLPVISNLQASAVQAPGLAAAPGPMFHIEFDYNNVAGGIATVHTQFKWEFDVAPCPVVDSTPATATAASGHYAFDEASCAQNGCNCDVTVSIVDGYGRTSNVLKVAATGIPC
jgi:hypothetical protein